MIEYVLIMISIIHRSITVVEIRKFKSLICLYKRNVINNIKYYLLCDVS
jgi:hypothetical protein